MRIEVWIKYTLSQLFSPVQFISRHTCISYNVYNVSLYLWSTTSGCTHDIWISKWRYPSVGRIYPLRNTNTFLSCPPSRSDVFVSRGCFNTLPTKLILTKSLLHLKDSVVFISYGISDWLAPETNDSLERKWMLLLRNRFVFLAWLAALL